MRFPLSLSHCLVVAVAAMLTCSNPSSASNDDDIRHREERVLESSVVGTYLIRDDSRAYGHRDLQADIIHEHSANVELQDGKVY